ncbi:MAG: glycerol-3-phosphate dehydrogenase/oxidase [Myxococcales bacterium]|nr:glycerol-3-phosphate dehydrogenase/oxidase [Myxococcales bacterium]
MLREPDRLEKEPFDLLIVGGGITGATLAWDAALRGLRVALVERGDFGGATTSATSKLIHGGLRYLKNGELGLVRESLRERRILQMLAPHLVRPQPFLIPTYRRGNRKTMIRAGMLLYGALSWDRGRLADPEQRLPGHRMLDPAATMAAEPVIGGEGLTGGARYYDCRCEPERLCLEFVRAAASRGALVLNYCPVTALQLSQGRVSSVEVLDRLEGRRREVRTAAVVNAAGPWADSLDALAGLSEPVALRRSKGIHLVTRPLTREHALVLRTRAGRHFFVIPWHARSLIGTTDSEYVGSPDRFAVSDADEAEFLAEVNEALPRAGLRAADVVYRYGGMRPLVDQETSVYQASRRYEILDYRKRGCAGLFSVVGGKYTTSRNLAQKVIDRVMAYLGRPKVSCATALEPLPGTPRAPLGEFRRQLLERYAHLPATVVSATIDAYGNEAQAVLEMIARDEALAEPIGDAGETLAHLEVAVRDEMAVSLCDVLTRRTGVGNRARLSEEDLEKSAAFVARRCGWTPERTRAEMDLYRDKTRGIPDSPARLATEPGATPPRSSGGC